MSQNRDEEESETDSAFNSINININIRNKSHFRRRFKKESANLLRLKAHQNCYKLSEELSKGIDHNHNHNHNHNQVFTYFRSAYKTFSLFLVFIVDNQCDEHLFPEQNFNNIQLLYNHLNQFLET